MKIKNRIDELVKLREELNNEIKELVKACPHDEYHIGTYSWRVGAFDNMRICIECYTPLGNPSENEIEDFNNEYDELNKEYIEKRRIEKENNKDNNVVYVDSSRIGQGTKIYKKNF